jgi:hypothetical protein
MPYFPLTTLQDMALAFFLGLGTLVLLYAAWTFYPPAPPEGCGAEREPEGVGSGEEQKKDDNPVPPFLIMAYLAVIVWALAYLILVGLGGKAIG